MKKLLMLVPVAMFACAAIVARADFKDDGGGDGGAHDAQEHNPLERVEQGDEGNFLVFGSMVGVDGSFLASDAIRGLSGDALPRTIAMGRGSLGSDGHLRINVRGLVLANDTSVPAASRGTNDSATFRGLVSCESEKSGGGTMTVNVMTAPFHASTTGNAEINGSVTLPAQCLAPIVFVTNAAGDKWLAVVGTERSTTTQ